MEAVRTSETSVDNLFTWQYNPEDNSEHNTNFKSAHYAMYYSNRVTWHFSPDSCHLITKFLVVKFETSLCNVNGVDCFLLNSLKLKLI
jgi:hypothetical protein